MEGRKRKERRKKVRVLGIISRKNIAAELNGMTPKGDGLMPTLRPTRKAKHLSLPLITWM